MLNTYLEKYTNFHMKLKEKLPLAYVDTEIPILINILLLRHIGQIVCNAQTIQNSDYNCETGNFFSDDDNMRGVALYPSVSMMNHSCTPNIYLT